MIVDQLPTLIVLSGLPGSGKTTIAKQIARAIDRDGNLIHAMAARATVGFRPNRVTTDGHGSYPGRSAACRAGPSGTAPAPA